MGMGAIFSMHLFSKKFHRIMKMIDVSYWHGSMGNMSVFDLFSVFRLHIFCLGVTVETGK